MNSKELQRKQYTTQSTNVKEESQNESKIKGAKILLMGITFKENCPDIRNTKVVDIYRELKEFGVEVDVYDPWAEASEVKREYGIDILSDVEQEKDYQAIILAVAHEEFKNFDFKKYKQRNAIIYDVKNVIDRSLVDGRL